MALISGLESILPLIQTDFLNKEFLDALFPEQQWRGEAQREEWAAGIGDEQLRTRNGLIPPDPSPLPPGVDPDIATVPVEQWRVRADPYGKTLKTDMADSRASPANLLARDAKSLAMHAGQSMNLVVRNHLMVAYLGANTFASLAGSSDSVVPVRSVVGWSFATNSQGREEATSAANPKVARLGASATTVNVISVQPLESSNPLGPGLLTLDAPATWADGVTVVALDASRQINAGGATSTDGLIATDGLDFEAIRAGVAHLQKNFVPTHMDGYYHCHAPPQALEQLFSDNEFQRVHEGRFDADPYKKFLVAEVMGCKFYRNAQSATVDTVGILTASGGVGAPLAQGGFQIGSDVVNDAGFQIIRTTITGGGAIYENYIPESEYLTSAGTTGMVGKFTITPVGVQINLDGIRYIIRAPLDARQQQILQTWSISAGWGVPSDAKGGVTIERFKRAVVINSGAAA